MDKDMSILSESGRMAMGELNSTLIKTNRKSSLGLSVSSLHKTNIQRENVSGDDKRLQKSLAEKDRQITLLQQQVLLANSRANELKEEGEKFKRQGREAKRLLSSKETNSKRQSIALKQAQDRLTSIITRDERKVKRSLLERKELEKQFEDLEIEYEEYIELVEQEKEKDRIDFEAMMKKHTEEMSVLQSKYDRDVETVRSEQAEEINQLTEELEGTKSFAEDLSMRVTSLNETIRLLSEENDELRNSFEESTASSTKLQSKISDNEVTISQYMSEVSKKDVLLKELNERIVVLSESYESKIIELQNASTHSIQTIQVKLQESVKNLQLSHSEQFLSMQRIGELEEINHTNQVTIGNLKHDLKEYEMQDTENSRIIESANKQIQDLNKRLYEVNDWNAKMKDSISQLASEKEALAQQLSDIAAQTILLDSSKIEIESKLTKQIAQLKEDKTAMAVILESGQTSYKALKEKMNSLTTTVNDLSAQLDQSRQALQIAEQSNIDLSNEKASKESELRQLLADIKKQREEFSAKGVMMIEDLTNQYHEDKAKISRQYEEKLHAKELLLEELKKSNADLTDVNSKLQMKMIGLEESNQDSLEEISALSKSYEETKGYYDALIQSNEKVVNNLHTTITELRDQQLENAHIMSAMKSKLVSKEEELVNIRKKIEVVQFEYQNKIEQLNSTNEEMKSFLVLKDSEISNLTGRLQCFSVELENEKKMTEGLLTDKKNLEYSVTSLNAKIIEIEQFYKIEIEKINTHSKMSNDEKSSAILALQNENIMISSNIANQRKVIEQLEMDKKSLKVEIDNLVERMMKAEDYYGMALKSKCEEFSNLNSSKNKEISDIQNELSTTKTILDDLTKKYHEELSLKSSLQTEILSIQMNLEEQKDSSIKTMKDMKASYDSLEVSMVNQITSLTNEKKSLTASLEEDKVVIDTLKSHVEELKADILKLKKKMVSVEDASSKTISDLTELHESCEQAKDNMIASLHQQIEESNKSMGVLKKQIIDLESSHEHSMNSIILRNESSMNAKDTTIRELRAQQIEMLQALATVKAKALAHEDATNKAMDLLKKEHDEMTKEKDDIIYDLQDQYDNLVQEAAKKADEEFSSNPRIQALEVELRQMRDLVDSMKKESLPGDELTFDQHTRKELNMTREELMRLKAEHDLLSGEHAYLISRNNNRQKIHYVWSLKKQISDLIEENNRLRNRVINIAPSKQFG